MIFHPLLRVSKNGAGHVNPSQAIGESFFDGFAVVPFLLFYNAKRSNLFNSLNWRIRWALAFGHFLIFVCSSVVVLASFKFFNIAMVHHALQSGWRWCTRIVPCCWNAEGRGRVFFFFDKFIYVENALKVSRRNGNTDQRWRRYCCLVSVVYC